jgi:heat shock protein HslJ
MPDTPDFDDARRALNEVPAPDLWDEAQRRAADGSAVPLAVGIGRSLHPGRWLAVAAAAALAIGTVAVLADDGDQSVDTSPQATTSTSEDRMVGDGLTIVGPDGCRIGMDGDDIRVESGPAQPPRFDPAGQPPGQLVYNLSLGDSQVAELHVPGVVVRDLVGERVEDVELRRGTAQVWFGTDFVQVRWFTGSQGPCGSFTVTVSGGNEDANRHAAVDLADRMLVASELSDPSLRHTNWQLERSTMGGVPTAGQGSTFSFGLTEVQWSDGCNSFSSSFEQADPETLVLVDGITSTDAFCDPNRTTDAIAAVMSTDLPIDVGYEGTLLTLRAGGVLLTLRPPSDGPTSSVTTSTGGSTTTTTIDGVTTTTLPTGGVQGTVTAGPTCPVETPDEPCPPEPLATHVVALDADGDIAAETDSDADGRYAMPLPSGSYTLRAGTPGGFPSCPDIDFSLPVATMVVVDISCDTGIR